MFALEAGIHRIHLGGRWTFSDLNKFSRIYSQLYAFHYSLTSKHLLKREDISGVNTRIKDPYIAHPWIGGWDTVNFYRQLERRVPPPHKLTLVGMHYASPGWIDIGAVAIIAIAVRKIVHALIEDASRINTLCNEITRGMRERQLMKIKVKRQELKLARETMQFLEDSNRKLSSSIKLEHAVELYSLTGNPLTTLRILRSHERKLRKLSEYENKGKTKI